MNKTTIPTVATNETFQVSFTRKEIDVLAKAVELWEKEPSSSWLLGSMFGAMLGPREGDPGYDAHRRKEDELQRQQEDEVRARAVTSLKMRARLLEVLERPAEFHP